MFFKFRKYAALIATCILFAACAKATITGEEGLKIVNTISKEDTYVVYEMPKGKKNLLLPSFCAVKEGTEYRLPGSTKEIPTCQYGGGAGWLFNPLGDGFTLSLLSYTGSYWYERTAVESADPNFGTFHFVKVHKISGTHYFPAFYLLGRKLILVQGDIPVHRIQKGKVNYIGRWPGAKKNHPDWRPQGVGKALAASGVKLLPSSLVINVPKKGSVSCEGKSFLTGNPSTSASDQRCKVIVQ